MNKDVLFSHKTDDWFTPTDIYQWFVDHGYYDPCPLHGSEAFEKPWGDRNFVNPPYSNILPFVKQAKLLSYEGKKTWFLVPARTDTEWFKELFGYCDFVFFIHGRLRFGGSSGNAPFPSVLMRCAYYENRQDIKVIDRESILSYLDWVEEFWK